MSGNGRYLCWFSARNINLLNERIAYVASFIPNMFARKLRTTDEAAHYKYIELRQFVLYTGKILLLYIMPSEEQYQHFLNFSVVYTLMVDEKYARDNYELQNYPVKNVVVGFA